MRLIDADELKKKFNERSYWTYTQEYGDAIPIGWIMSGIDNAPTVCGNNPKWCESCVSKGKCVSTRPEFQTESLISRYQKDIMKEDDHSFITLMNCPSCGNCMWRYENDKIVCAICGYIAERS